MDQQYSPYRSSTPYKENKTPPSIENNEKGNRKAWTSTVNKGHRMFQKPGQLETRPDNTPLTEEQDVMQRANQIVMYVLFEIRQSQLVAAKRNG